MATEKPFAFEAAKANLQSGDQYRRDRDRTFPSGKSLSFAPHLTNGSTLNEVGSGYYVRNNDDVHASFYFPFATRAGAGAWTLSLPVPASFRTTSKSLFWQGGIWCDAGINGAWFGALGVNSVDVSSLIVRFQTSFGGQLLNLGATVPVTWSGTAAALHGWVTYEALSGFTETD